MRSPTSMISCTTGLLGVKRRIHPYGLGKSSLCPVGQYYAINHDAVRLLQSIPLLVTAARTPTALMLLDDLCGTRVYP